MEGVSRLKPRTTGATSGLSGSGSLIATLLFFFVPAYIVVVAFCSPTDIWFWNRFW